MKIILYLVLSILSGIFYRIGGSSKEEAKKEFPWFPSNLVNTKVRDVGVSLMAILVFILLSSISLPWWILLLTLLLMFGSMTTYCTFGEQEDVYWYNWFLTGILYGLSALPITCYTGKWLGFGIRTIILGFGIMIWSEVNSDARLEEFGRGALFTLTIPLLCL